jgi:hypothetical protein
MVNERETKSKIRIPSGLCRGRNEFKKVTYLVKNDDIDLLEKSHNAWNT